MAVSFDNLVYDTLKTIRDRIAENIIDRGLNATGDTIRSMRIEVTGQGKGTLYGRQYFQSLEEGRPPTDSKPSRAMISSLQRWIDARGIDTTPWAVANSINKNGTRLWRDGGRKDIYTEAINKTIEEVKDEVDIKVKAIMQNKYSK